MHFTLNQRRTRENKERKQILTSLCWSCSNNTYPYCIHPSTSSGAVAMARDNFFSCSRKYPVRFKDEGSCIPVCRK